MASIAKVANGYRARYRTPAGQSRSRTFKRKTDAERFLVTVEHQKATGGYVDPSLGRVTVESWGGRWYATTVNLKPKTRVGYESLLRTRVVPAFGNRPLATVTTLDVKEWVAAMSNSGLSPSRVRQAYRVLSAMMGAAVESGYLARTPCANVTLPRLPTTEMAFLNAGQIEGLAATVEDRYRALVYVLAYGGLRWGEAAALRRGRCQLLRHQLEVRESAAEVNGTLHYGETKTYRARMVVLPAFLTELLAQHLERFGGEGPDGLVFTGPGGGPLRNGNFTRRVWRPAVKAAGLPGGLRIHDLRHTCASLLISQVASVKAVQAQLGHSTATLTLDRYGHLFPDEMDRLAEALEAVHVGACVSCPCHGHVAAPVSSLAERRTRVG